MSISDTQTLTTPDGDLGIHIVRPEGDGQFPVVVSFHHGPGLDEESKEAMGWIADAGYYVISHDRYHRHGAWRTFDTHALRAEGADQQALHEFIEILGGTTDEMVEADLSAVLAHLAGDPAAREAPMGCIGYCIGARSVLRTMAWHPDVFAAGVALHPSVCTTADPDSPHLGVPGLPGHLYVGFGSEDEMQPVSDNQPLIEAVERLGDHGEVEIHEGADHGFAVPGPAYHEAASARSYERALDLFKRTIA